MNRVNHGYSHSIMGSSCQSCMYTDRNPSFSWQFLGLEVLVLFHLVLCTAVVKFSTDNADPNTDCIEDQKVSLLNFKHRLEDPSNWLSSLMGQDCRKWSRSSLEQLNRLCHHHAPPAIHHSILLLLSTGERN